MKRLTEPQSIFLDALRGLSALAVMLGHVLSFLPWAPAIGNRYPIQSYAVIVFFMLSGFLIGFNTMRRSETYSLAEYLIDRFCRIFVAFVPALFLVAAVDAVVALSGPIQNATHTGATFAANLLMLHHTPFDRYFEWLQRFEPYGTGRAFWTIAVEWWLYVLFGIVFFVGRLKRYEKIVAAVLVLPAAAVVLYFTAWESVALIWVVSAAVGIFFVVTPEQGRRQYLPAVFAAAALTLGALVYRFTRLDLADTMNFYDLQLILLSTFLFALVVQLVTWRPFASALRASGPLWGWLAAISYSLYLTHGTIVVACRRAFGMSDWTGAAIAVVLSLSAAILFNFAFDRHHRTIARWMKHRLINGETGSVDQATTDRRPSYL